MDFIFLATFSSFAIIVSLVNIPSHSKICRKGGMLITMKITITTTTTTKTTFLGTIHYKYEQSAGQNLLFVPKSNTKSNGNKSFEITAAKLWKALPPYIRFADSKAVLKSPLRTLLFYNYYQL